MENKIKKDVENKEQEKSAPVGLEDEVLDTVSGGSYGEQEFDPERLIIRADCVSSYMNMKSSNESSAN